MQLISALKYSKLIKLIDKKSRNLHFVPLFNNFDELYIAQSKQRNLLGKKEKYTPH